MLTRDKLPLDKLRPATVVRHAFDGGTIPLSSLHCICGSNGLTVTSASPCDLIAVYSISGKQVATFDGTQGFIPYAAIGIGTYIIQALRGTERSAVRFTVLR